MCRVPDCHHGGNELCNEKPAGCMCRVTRVPDCHHGGGAFHLSEHLYEPDHLPAAVLAHQLLLVVGQRHHRPKTAVQDDVDVLRLLALSAWTLAE